MKYETIRWNKDKVELIDQRLLPLVTRYVACRTERDIWNAIKAMKIRGAPAIGIAGAYGVYLGINKSRAKTYNVFKKDLDKTIKYLASSRPTAQNLFWALEKMKLLAEKNKNLPIADIKRLLLKEANKVLEEDVKICRAIGENGKGLIGKNSGILTHCNAGGLATGGYGTALGVIFSARDKIKMVYADETRPLLQGARLTVWELTKEKVPVTVICDNMAASLMAKRKIDAVIVGADRIAANGDTANKIGTYGVAVLAAYHKIPFYVAAPVSTFDLSLATGASIPIEQRAHEEVKKIHGKYVTVKDIDAENPAFDVTPAGLITAIVTERGVITRPDSKKIKRSLLGS